MASRSYCMRRVSKRSVIHFKQPSDLSFHMRSSQVRAWFCGSMMSGKRFDFSMMIPFCFESSSLGRPCRFQEPILSAETRKLMRSRSSLNGNLSEIAIFFS